MHTDVWTCLHELGFFFKSHTCLQNFYMYGFLDPCPLQLHNLVLARHPSSLVQHLLTTLGPLTLPCWYKQKKRYESTTGLPQWLTWHLSQTSHKNADEWVKGKDNNWSMYSTAWMTDNILFVRLLQTQTGAHGPSHEYMCLWRPDDITTGLRFDGMVNTYESIHESRVEDDVTAIDKRSLRTSLMLTHR